MRAADAAAARDWLAAREFRVASKLSRLNADATQAIEDLSAGKITPQAALLAVRSDVLDGYQARFNDALRDLQGAQAQGFYTLAAEQKRWPRDIFTCFLARTASSAGQRRLER